MALRTRTGPARPPKPPRPPKTPGLGSIVLDDLRTGDVRRTFRRELRQIYDFYLDEDRKARLAPMGRLKRWLFISLWVLRSMVLKLSPARRVAAVAALALMVVGNAQFRFGDRQLTIDTHTPAFIIMILLFMLELRDKLLAHDELAIGRQVQLALLPRENPHLAGWNLWLYTRPANDVGGDLVDFIRLERDRLGVILGDVSGKGLGAALLMARLQATVRALAPGYTSLETFGRSVNEIFCRDGLPNRFATVVYVELSADSGGVRLVNAGHLPPVVIKGGAIETLDTPEPLALPLGMFETSRFAEQHVQLEAGEMIFLYSDGLTEAWDKDHEFFGDDRVHRLLTHARGESPDALGRRVLAEVERFVGDEPQSDDLSLVILKKM